MALIGRNGLHRMAAAAAVVWLGSLGVAAAGGTAVPFLNFGIGAREPALGGAMANADGVNALMENPAGLARIRGSEFSLGHAEWLLDTRFDAAAFAVPRGRWSAAWGAAYLASGRQDGRDENRNPTGTFTAADLALLFGTSYAPTAQLSLGASIKAVDSRIADASARTFAVDTGAQLALDRSSSRRLGVAIRNAGPGLRFDGVAESLPLLLAVSIDQRIWSTILVRSEWQYEPADASHHLVLGCELRPAPSFALRGGLLSRFAGGPRSTGLDFQNNGLVGGFGMRLGRYDLDYAFTPFGELGEVHRFSIVVRFAGASPQASPSDGVRLQ